MPLILPAEWNDCLIKQLFKPENLQSVLNIRILAIEYRPNIPTGEVFQEMILKNPKALHSLRNLEKFEN